MRKMLMVLAFAGFTCATFAQEAPVKKHSVATNSFWSNWFIQGNVHWDSWYSSEEHGLDLARSPFDKFRSNPGFSVAVGKWFTPGFGLRMKAQGIWGKRVTDDNNDGNGNKYWILNGHALFNLSNMLCGYNPNRVWNFIPFIGAGIGRTMTYNLYSQGLSVGLLNEFNVSKRVAINLELGWNRMESDIDGGPQQDITRTRGWDTHDNNLYAEIGLTFNIGKTGWDAVPDVDAINSLHKQQLDEINDQLQHANAENARLKSLIANQKPQAESKSVKEFVTTPVSVFFDLDKTEIAVLKDLVNVESVVKFAKDNNRKLLVTGYADSATGSVEHNQWLSERRAERLVNEIVKMGFDRNNITSSAKGGVKLLSVTSPVSYDRRATVQIVEE